MQVCRGTVVQRFRETEVKWCRFAKLQRCRGVEKQRYRCCADVEVQVLV